MKKTSNLLFPESKGFSQFEISPFHSKDLKIDINANRTYSENFSENFKVVNSQYNALNPNISGNFAISSVLIKTSFEDSNQYKSQTFQDFQNNRLIVAKRLAAINGNSSGGIDEDGFPVGYGKNNQSVLIPAFISAYSGKDPNDISLNAVRKIPLPNWSIQYTGLISLDFFKHWSLSDKSKGIIS